MKTTRIWLWLFFLLCGLFCVAFAFDWLPWLRGNVPFIPYRGKWIWNIDTPRWAWAAVCGGALAIYVAGAVTLLRDQALAVRYPVRLILWAFVGSTLVALAAMAMEDPVYYLLFTRSASPGTGGYLYASEMIYDINSDAVRDMESAFRHWPEFVREWRIRTNANPPGGVALSPPGFVALYHGQTALFEAAPSLADQMAPLNRALQCQNLYMMTWRDAGFAGAWFQMWMPLWAALGVAPLYRLVARLFDRERARIAVTLWPLVPGMAIFMPRYNVFYALVTLGMLLALWRGLDRDRLRWIGMAGFIISVSAFTNLSLVPLGLLAGLVILGARLPRRWQRAALDLAALGAGSASMWLIYWALSGLSPIDLLDFLMNQHYDLYRPYAPWVFMHVYDMFLFVGVPVAGFALWRIARIRLRSDSASGDLLAGATALTVLALALSGTARGETGRVWLFFAPIWIALAADGLARLTRREQAIFIALQAVCLLSMAAVLRANFTALTLPTQPPVAQAAPAFPLNARFERDRDAVTLVGLTVEPLPTEVILRLHWRAESRVMRPYALSLISIAPDGHVSGDMSWNPLNWEYPLTCWSPGREFVDTVRVPVGAPGEWLFSLSVLDAFTGEAMSVTQPDGQESTQVGIGPINVPKG